MLLPKYMRIQQGLVNMIASEKMCIGTMLPSERKLGRLFGCNVITLRKALTNLQKNGIIRKENRLGSFVNAEIKGNLSSGTIGYLFINQSLQKAPVIDESMDVINTSLLKRGYKLKVLSVGSTPTKDLIENLQGLSGVIVTGWINEQWVSLLRGLNLPIVVVGITQMKDLNLPYAIYDYRKMTIMLGKYWLEQGAKKIGLITVGDNYGASFAMREGFRYLLTNSSSKYNSDLVLFAEGEEHGHDIWDFLDSNKDIDAIIVELGLYSTVLSYLVDNPRQLSVGVMSEYEYKRVMPKNVIFSGFHDNVFNKGVELMFDVIEAGDKKVKNIKLKPYLIK